MNFLKRLGKLFDAAPQKEQYVYWVYARCNRCGEPIRGRVNMMNDLSLRYKDVDGVDGYYTRKVLMGGGRCYQQVEIELEFDLNRKLKNREIRGGVFITEKEYLGSATQHPEEN